MRAVTLHYTLRNGHRGTLVCIARSSADAILQALDVFGAQLRACSARPGVSS
jgi:hypothetical protein